MPRPLGCVMGWSSMAQMHVTGHELRLMVAVMQEPSQVGWQLFAFETAMTSKTAKDVLGSHAHEVLPMQRTLSAAIAFAEKYAENWQRDRKTALRCTCGSIEASE